MTLADVLIRPSPEITFNANRPVETFRSLTLLGSLACLLIVLVRLFKAKGALHGIFGILSCGIYPFIWGWTVSAGLHMRKIMALWTAVLAITIILSLSGSRPSPRPFPPQPPPSEPVPNRQLIKPE